MVHIARNGAGRGWNFYGLLATIEVARHRKGNPAVPAWLKAERTIDANIGCALIAAISAKLKFPAVLDAFSALAHDQSGHGEFGISAVDCVDDIFAACRELLCSSVQHSDGI